MSTNLTLSTSSRRACRLRPGKSLDDRFRSPGGAAAWARLANPPAVNDFPVIEVHIEALAGLKSNVTEDKLGGRSIAPTMPDSDALGKKVALARLVRNGRRVSVHFVQVRGGRSVPGSVEI